MPAGPTSLGLLLLAAIAAGPAAAQVPSVPSASHPAAAKQPEPDPFGRDTPHGTAIGFLRAAARENYQRAAEYLNVKSAPDSQELARKLMIVLNVGLSSDLDRLSKDPEGDLLDGLPPTRELVGTVDSSSGKLDIFLDRVPQKDKPPVWLFSAATLRSVPAVFAEVDAFSVEEHVPQALRENKIFSVPLYRWLEIILGVLLGLLLAGLVTRILIRLLRPLLRRISPEEADRLLARMRAPVRLIFLSACFRALAAFSVTLLARRTWTRFAVMLAVIGFAWLVIRSSDIAAELAVQRLTRRQRASKLAVLNLLHRLFKIGVAVLAAVVMIYASGKDVSTLLAGLGLGGIALAFAAQKTLENLFGGVSLISDEPMRVGDFCRLGDKTGTVEDIGLRSTRVRTNDRTVLSIPNGQLAQMNIENFALRDKFFCNHQIGLRYETTPEQIRQVLAGVRDLLRAHPNVDQSSARVRLTAFSASSLNVELFLYMMAADYPAFLEFQEDLLLAVLDVIVACGSGLAFPSQTTYLARDKTTHPEAVEQAAARVHARSEQARASLP